MKCPKCGNEARPDSQFCTTCGSPLDAVALRKGGTFVGYTVGIVILVVSISLGWMWYLVTPEYYKTHDIGYFVTGLLACVFLAAISLALVIWTSNKGLKSYQMFLKASAFLVPFIFSFFGCNGGVAWGNNISNNDYPLGEVLLGILIGFAIGGWISAYLLVVTSRSQTQSKETSHSQGKSA